MAKHLLIVDLRSDRFSILRKCFVFVYIFAILAYSMSDATVTAAVFKKIFFIFALTTYLSRPQHAVYYYAPIPCTAHISRVAAKQRGICFSLLKNAIIPI